MIRRDGTVRLRPIELSEGSAGGEELVLPQDCRVRLIDLAYGVGAAIALDEDGTANIYVNARLSREAQRRALRHELWHYYREDMFREAGIREIERVALPAGTPPTLFAMDGSRLIRPVPVFAPEGLRRVGRGLYLPEGENRDRAARDLRALCTALEEACRAYDVLQTPPLLPAERLHAACAELDARAEDAVAFIAWRPESGGEPSALPVVLQFCRGDAEGALYYDAEGRADNAVAQLHVEHDGRTFRLTMDVRRRRGRLTACAVRREVDGGRSECIYG